MMNDVVVDTNVLVQASNPGVSYGSAALAFVQSLHVAATHVCIDEGFSVDTAQNSSLIGHEYLQHLHAGMVGYELIVALALAGRVKIVKRAVPTAVARRIQQLVRNKRDRTFLQVTYNSEGRTFVSHDFRDFSASKRQTLRGLDLRVVTADVAESEL